MKSGFKYEPTPKTVLLPQKHKNTKSHQNKFREYQYFVQFGALEIWWHFLFFDFSEWTQI